MPIIVRRTSAAASPVVDEGGDEFLACDLTVATASRTDVVNGLNAVSPGDTVCVPPG